MPTGLGLDSFTVHSSQGLFAAELLWQHFVLFLRWGELHRGLGVQEEVGLVLEALEEPQGRDTRSRAPRSLASPPSRPRQVRRQEGERPQRDQGWAEVPALVRPHMCPRIHQSSRGRCLGNLRIVGR